MATYKSRFKGSQVDEAVTIANNNLNKGSSDTPIFYDADGYGQAIEKDTVPTVSSVKPLTSGGAYDGLSEVVNNSDVQNQNFIEGDFSKQGSIQIVNGVVSGFSSTSYVYKTFATQLTQSDNYKIRIGFTPNNNSSIQCVFSLGGNYKIPPYFCISASNAFETTYRDSSNHEHYIYDTLINNQLNILEIENVNSTTYFKMNGTLTHTLTDFANVIKGLYTVFVNSNFLGSIDLKEFSVEVDGKVVYSPYPYPTLPPSQGAAKQYIDAEAATKQDQMSGGYGVELKGTTFSVSDDIFREGQEVPSAIKVSYFTDFETKDNSEVYEMIDKARYSTFDKSKFYKTGHVDLTDDGIVSNIPATVDEGNIRTIDFETPLNLADKKTVFKMRLKWDNSSWLGAQVPVSYNSFRTAFTLGGFWEGRDPSNNRFGTQNSTSFKNQVPVGRWFDFEWIIDDVNKKTGYVVKYNGNIYSEMLDYAETPNFSANIPHIGFQYGGSYRFYGSIDLKRFEIIVNGEEFFSGSKQGADLIKGTDFEVVANSTSYPNPSLPFSQSNLKISESGMCSGFSNTNFVRIPAITNNGTTEKISIDFLWNGEASNLNNIIAAREDSVLWLYLNTANHAASRQPSAYGTEYCWSYTESTRKDARYTIEFSLNKQTHKLTTSLYLEGVLISRGTVDSTCPSLFAGSWLVGAYGSNVFFHGKIDLSSIKIYVDDKIAYRPCVAVPFSESKDGKKIVDGLYRNRISQQYNEVGYTPYYALEPSYRGNFLSNGYLNITPDWIVSGFQNNSNFVKYNIPTYGSSMKWTFRFKTPESFSASSTSLVIHLGSSSSRICVYSKGLWITFFDSSGTSIINVGTSALSDSTWYEGSVEFTGTQYIRTLNGVSTVITNSSTPVGQFTQGDINVEDDSEFLVDLSKFKIYVDGKLAYSAVPTYSLATVEANDIVDEFLEGSTSYVQRANSLLEQQGTCLEGSTVQFPKAFTNTDYFLSVPYVTGSKSTSGFTSARSGDYFAEGSIASLSNSNSSPLEVYDFIIDQSISDPYNAVSYSGFNTAFTPAKMDYTNDVFDWGSWRNTFLYNAFRPCMLTYAGAVDYYLDPNDYTKKLDGTASDVADTTYGGNAMVEFDQIWIKEKNENGKFRISIANSQVDEDYDCWTHMRKDGTLNQYAYRSCYDGSNVDNIVRSISGLAPLRAVSGTTMAAYAKANGAGYNIEEWSQRRLLNYLLILMGKSLNTQQVFGYGLSSASGPINSGSADNKGLFYGANNYTTCSKVFGIEHLWGNLYKLGNGLIFVNGSAKCKMCEGTVDGSTVVDYNTDGSGYISSNFTTYVEGVSGAIKAMKLIPSLGMIPSDLTSSSFTQYYCDRAYIDTSKSEGVAHFGAPWNLSEAAGAFAMHCHENFAWSHGVNGVALTYKAQPSS